jgi:hypothetical protein
LPAKNDNAVNLMKTKLPYDANADQLSRNAICSSWRSLRSAAQPS